MKKSPFRITTISVVIVVLFTVIFTLSAQDTKPTTGLSIDRITLFKNGIGFFVSSGSVPAKITNLRVGQLPIPSYGTFWVGYTKDLSVKKITSSIEEYSEQSSSFTFDQLIESNIGKKVIIRTDSTSKDPIEGTILSLSKFSDNQNQPNPYMMESRHSADISGRTTYSAGGLVMLKSDKGIIAISTASITRVDFAESDPAKMMVTKQKKPSLRMEFDKNSTGGKISVSYLARGITWSPSYLIDLTDPKIAKFSANAIIINELTDLKNVEIECVTGFPNLKFSDIASPIAKSQSLAEFLNALSSGNHIAGGGRMGLMAQQAVLTNVGDFSDISDPSVDYQTVTDGSTTEDLFLYPLKNFSLKKDETAWVPLFSAEMPYKHIYTWKISDYNENDNRNRASDGLIKAEEVWHSCRLTNTLKMPLTTAPAEFMSNGSLVGQDICYYTTPSTNATIRINKALNILAEQSESEIERKRDALTFSGYGHDLVTVKGNLVIRNKYDKVVNIEITKELSGEVVDSLPKGKVKGNIKGLSQVNAKNQLSWELELKPGAVQKISYKYQCYVRR